MVKNNNHNVTKLKGFNLQIIPYSEIRELSISERVKKILKLVLGNRVVILQGRLRAEEEIRLIEDTMAMVDHVKNFKGIELAVVEPDSGRDSLFFRMKRGLAKRLVGDNNALTIVGPASIVKEIKRDPKKIEVLLG
jgi:hypothetical protein